MLELVVQGEQVVRVHPEVICKEAQMVHQVERVVIVMLLVVYLEQAVAEQAVQVVLYLYQQD